jgi:hypothetical protein
MSIGRRLSDKVIFAFRSIFLFLCLYLAVSGHYPPVLAQRPQQVPVPVLTVEDAMQDHDIAEVNKHLEATDAKVQKQWDKQNKIENDLSGLQGEERIIGAVLTLLSGSGIILQIRKKQA